MARKTNFKFEGVDIETGKRFRVSLDGWVPEDLLESIKECINRIILGSEEGSILENKNWVVDSDELTIKKKIEILILKNFRRGWFTSRDVKEQYVMMYNEDVSISTISMCLRRMYDNRILDRRGSRAQRMYRLNVEKVRDEIERIKDIEII
ncbi:MAG: hypothetical protein ACTSR0_04600 [Candidatus Asgardarchaeia archaeon]